MPNCCFLLCALQTGRRSSGKKIMDDFLFFQSATVNEVSMLNCAMDTSSSVCVPNGPPLEFYLVSESSGVVLAGSSCWSSSGVRGRADWCGSIRRRLTHNSW